MIRGLIFDLDGTLVDSLPGIAVALNHALEDLNLPSHSREAVSGFIGDGVENLVRRALGPDMTSFQDDVLSRFKAHYSQDWKTGTHPYPGMVELLGEFFGLNLPMAVLSNKPHSYTVEIVEALFPGHLFHPVQGHEPGKPRKPDPTTALEIVQRWNFAPTEVAYVGDSSVDLETAEAARLTPLIFSWGYGTPANHHLLHSASDLRDQVINHS